MMCACGETPWLQTKSAARCLCVVSHVRKRAFLEPPPFTHGNHLRFGAQREEGFGRKKVQKHFFKLEWGFGPWRSRTLQAASLSLVGWHGSFTGGLFVCSTLCMYAHGGVGSVAWVFQSRCKVSQQRSCAQPKSNVLAKCQMLGARLLQKRNKRKGRKWHCSLPFTEAARLISLAARDRVLITSYPRGPTVSRSSQCF
jgi:hypothetical protein